MEWNIVESLMLFHKFDRRLDSNLQCVIPGNCSLLIQIIESWTSLPLRIRNRCVSIKILELFSVYWLSSGIQI